MHPMVLIVDIEVSKPQKTKKKPNTVQVNFKFDTIIQRRNPLQNSFLQIKSLILPMKEILCAQTNIMKQIATRNSSKSSTIPNMPKLCTRSGSCTPLLRNPSSDRVQFAISNLFFPQSKTKSETGLSVTALSIQRKIDIMNAGHFEQNRMYARTCMTLRRFHIEFNGAARITVTMI